MTTVSALWTVVQRIDNLLLSEGAQARCIGDLGDAIVKLRSELDDIQQFLEAADANRHDNNENFKKQVTELAYNIEDAIESYARHEETTSKRKSVTIRCLLRGSTTRSLGEDIHIFNKRIDGLRHFMDHNQAPVENDVAAAGHSGRSYSMGTTITSSITPPQCNLQPRANQATVSWMDEEKRKLLERLTNAQSKLSIIPICGMGGSGKTTLAKMVFEDEIVVDHFDCRSWATVSQDFQARDILEAILLTLSSNWSTDWIAQMSPMQLMEQLYKAQYARRYLVVLDDVWSTEAWDTIKIAFPDNNNGSRVIITTRLQSVAEYSSSGPVHHMRFLDNKESWEIFKMESGLQDLGMQLDPKTEQIAKQIVSECGGLPLAVTVISHVLRGFKLEDWGVTLQSLQKDQNFETAEEVMALSYNHLPFYLKPCFLYLGHFPPDHEILVEKLYLLWMAEGFISMNPLNNKARTEVAEDYINQLVQRNLVLMVKPNHSCTLHDLLRDVSISKGKQDEFLEIIDFGHGNEISPKARRVSIYLDKFVDQSQFSINISEAKHIRSILFVETDKSLPKRTWPKTFSDLKEFQQTRVLDFDGVDFTDKRLPRGIEKLYYLRYLSFQQCNLQKLPSSLSNFPFLETLDLRVRVSCIITIPNILTKLSSLRHLYFPKAFRSDTKDKLKLDGLQKLEILENFNAGISDADDLLLLEKLEILTVTVAGENMDLDKTIRSLNGNKSSCKSSLVVKDFDSYSKQRIKIVEEMFKCNALHSLDIEGYLGKLPHSEPIGSNFSKMVFNGSEFSEDPMPILGKLPNLDSLVLCNDAFVGKKMECSDSDFPRLTSLKLATLQNLEEWEVDSAAMPCLTILTIEQCDKLINLPNELIEIFTLEKFMIGLMPKGFQEEVEELIEEARSFGNDYINATFYDC